MLLDVHCHHNVQAALFNFLQIEAVLRPGQCHHQQPHGQNQATEPDFAAGRRNPDGQSGQQPGLNELRQQPLPRTRGPPEKQRQRRRQHQQQPEQMWIRKLHLQIVNLKS